MATVAAFAATAAALSALFIHGLLLCEIGPWSETAAVVAASLLVTALAGAIIVNIMKRARKRIDDEEKLITYERTRFEVIYQNTTVNIWDYDFATKEIRQTQKSKAMHGHELVVPGVPESLVESKYVHPDTAQAFLDMYKKLYAGEKRAEGIFLVQNADRTAYWYEHIRYTTLFDDAGRPYGAIGMSTDVTEDEERKNAIRQWSELLSGMPGERTSIYEYNLSENTFIRRQGSLLPDAPELESGNFNLCMHEFAHRFCDAEDIGRVELFANRDRLIAAYLDAKREGSLDYRAKLPGGEKWVNLTLKLARYPGKSSIHAILIHTDIDERKRNELQLLSQAQSDPLTGSLNRDAFMHGVDEILTLMPDALHALIMLDLDDFKSINDTLGHMMGDQVLLKAAMSLRSLLRSGDLVGRIGGDEFMVFLKNLPNKEVVERRAEFINKMLYERLSTGISTSASLGIALYPMDGRNFEQLYKAADIAVYNSKGAGRNRFMFYSPQFEPLAGTTASPIDKQQASADLDEARKLQVQRILLENQRLASRQDEDERYRLIIERSGIDSFELNILTQKFSASRGYFRYVLSKQDGAAIFTENIDTSGIHPDDRAIFYGKFLEKVLSGESAPETHVRLELTSGGYRWCRMSAIVVADANGSQQKLIGTINEDDVQQSFTKAQFDAVLRFITSCVLLLEITGDKAITLFASESYYRMSGADKPETLNDDVFRYVHPDDINDLRSKVIICAQNGEALQHTFRVIRDGRVFRRHIQAVRIPYADSQNPVMLAVESDITDGK